MTTPVDLWTISLQAGPEELKAAYGLLAADEAARADRFYFEHDRRKFTMARASLRRLLARYLRCDPRNVSFAYGARGKPSVDGIEFNLSHSGELALLGVSSTGPLGVDIEAWRPLPDAEQIAARFFSRTEQQALMALPEDQRQEAFFACWTRKEAYIKALGDGLFTSLDRFIVTLTGPARLLHDDADPQAGDRFAAFDFVPAPGYSAAVMIAAEEPVFRRLDYAETQAAFDVAAPFVQEEDGGART